MSPAARTVDETAYEFRHGLGVGGMRGHGEAGQDYGRTEGSGKSHHLSSIGTAYIARLSASTATATPIFSATLSCARVRFLSATLARGRLIRDELRSALLRTTQVVPLLGEQRVLA